MVGWPVADGVHTIVVTHQLQVEHGAGEVHQSKTDVLPLCTQPTWKPSAIDRHRSLIDVDGT